MSAVITRGHLQRRILDLLDSEGYQVAKDVLRSVGVERLSDLAPLKYQYLSLRLDAAEQATHLDEEHLP